MTANVIYKQFAGLLGGVSQRVENETQRPYIDAAEPRPKMLLPGYSSTRFIVTRSAIFAI